jgi:hypothetical protein
MIRDVWESNLEMEMENIRAVVENYPYISMVILLACCILIHLGY